MEEVEQLCRIGMDGGWLDMVFGLVSRPCNIGMIAVRFERARFCCLRCNRDMPVVHSRTTEYGLYISVFQHGF